MLIIRGVKSYLQIRPSPGASLCTCAAEIIPGHPGCPLHLPPDTDINTHTHPSTIYTYIAVYMCYQDRHTSFSHLYIQIITVYLSCRDNPWSPWLSPPPLPISPQTLTGAGSADKTLGPASSSQYHLCQHQCPAVNIT